MHTENHITDEHKIFDKVPETTQIKIINLYNRIHNIHIMIITGRNEITIGSDIRKENSQRR